MKKILIITLSVLLLASCWAKTETKKEETKTKAEIQKEKNQKVMKQEYKDLTQYIKTDITDEESKELTAILEQRAEIQAEIKKMIEEVTEENALETFEKIKEKRKTCMNRILPYVAEDKKSAYLKYCEKINYSIAKKLNINNK